MKSLNSKYYYYFCSDLLCGARFFWLLQTYNNPLLFIINNKLFYFSWLACFIFFCCYNFYSFLTGTHFPTEVVLYLTVPCDLLAVKSILADAKTVKIIPPPRQNELNFLRMYFCLFWKGIGNAFISDCPLARHL